MLKIKKTWAFVAIGLATCLMACKKETINPPTVKVFDAAMTINQTSASVSAEVTDQGGAEVKSRGFVYGMSGGALDTLFCGSGTGIFSAELNNLEPNTTYVYEAFAKNAGGIATTGKLSFTTQDYSMPAVRTGEVSEITINSAKCGGEVTDDGGAEVLDKGICWSVNHSPMVYDSHMSSGAGNGGFTCAITELGAGKTYYVRAYATNSKGTAYGEEKSFTTLEGELAEVTTSTVIDITENSAKGGGEVTSDGGSAVIEKGICWNTSHNPVVGDSHAAGGTGIGGFTCDMTGLSTNTTYYVRAYAVNDKGTSYGNEMEFTTLSVAPSLPSVSTGNVTGISTTSAIGSGIVVSDGGSPVMERGLCWGTNHNPTIEGQHVAESSGTGEYNVSMTNLTMSTTYYVRAYATNGDGTAYGEEVEFTTLGVSVPGVTTSIVTDIGQTSAIGGGNVVSDGGSDVTERGICWGTNHNPSITDSHTSNGTGIGTFTVNMTNLTSGTTYYVRAYAVNVQGLAYGEEVEFTTNSVNMPTVTTNNVTNITQTSAKCGGNVTDAGGGTVTARGVCWSTEQNPTTSDSHTTNGSGTGSFTSNLTGLSSGTTYYVRAYATNSEGTSYGEQRTFTTNANVPSVTTNTVIDITPNSATCGGNVTNDGGGTVTSRGVCWGTSSNPTINNSHTDDGSGTGSFASNLTGLTPGTTYYVRAYATNNAGTGYGENRTFKTEESGSWLYYGDWDNHQGSMGLTNGGTMEWAVMFPTSILSQYAGTSITKAYVHADVVGAYTLKIYSGGTSQPATMVLLQSFNVTNTGWQTVNVAPLALVTTSNLWVSITQTQEAGEYPVGYCTGENNPNSRWYNPNGNGWTDCYNNNGNQDLSWEIQVWVTDQVKGERGLEIQLPQTPANPQQKYESRMSRNPHEGLKKRK